MVLRTAAEKTSNDWQYSTSASLVGGLNALLAPEDVDEAESPLLYNLRPNAGRLEVDTGYATFGSTVRGTPKRSYEFTRQSGSIELVLITNVTFYKWSTSATEWQYVSNGTSTTLSGNEASGQTVLSVTSETGFAAGEHVGIILNDGTEHKTTVASTAAGTITVDDALPSDADSGNTVVEALLLTATDSDDVDVVTVPFQDWVVFTNGVDAPKRYDGTTVEDVPTLPSSPFLAKGVNILTNHLCFFNTTEAGTAKPWRVRWADTGTSDFTTGNAGFRDLQDQPGGIVTARQLGTDIYIYKPKAIVRMQHVGTADLSFDFTTAVPNFGAVARHAVALASVNRRNVHVVLDRDSLYVYSGGTSVDDEVCREVCAFLVDPQRGELNPSKASRVFMVSVEARRETMLFYPSTGQDYPDRALIFNHLTGAFYPRRLGHVMHGFGSFTNQASLTWADLTGTWADQTYTWNSQATQANAPVIHLCGQSPLQVYEYNYTAGDDSGTAIAFEVQTKEFTDGHREERIDRIDALLRGTSITVEYSVDQGSTWTPIGTFSPGSSYQILRMTKQFITRSFRLRFTGSGQGFGIGWYGFRHREETSI